jgi:peptidyl-tRNA hydrolase, PTH1 family
VALFFKEFFRFFRDRGKPQTATSAQFCAEYLVFGIGNTGSTYANTRHNVGFMVVDRCLSRCRVLRKSTADHADIAAGDFSGKKVAFVKPTTFVNRSGTAFKSSMAAFCLPLGSCLVVVDDYNLPLGTMRFRPQGSDGGHNGLKSIIEAAGTEFPRLRIGIGPLPQGVSPVDFVLGTFTREDEKVLSVVLDRVVDGIAVFLNEGIERAMTSFNGPKTRPGSH